jgi:hypothetical protein
VGCEMRNVRLGRGGCFDPKRLILSPRTHNGLAHKNAECGTLREWMGWNGYGT